MLYNFEKSVDVQRLSPETESGDDRESYAAHLTGVACHIQPIDDSYSEDLDGSFGKESLMFCETHDIENGDRIIDGEIEYKVIGIKKFNFMGDTHMELRIRQYND